MFLISQACFMCMQRADHLLRDYAAAFGGQSHLPRAVVSVFTEKGK